MNLLSTNSADQSLYQEILSKLKEMWITQSELEVAEKFFDLSEEMDLSLLEGLKSRPLNKHPNNSQPSNFYDKLNKNRDKRYADRYLLFLDAVGGNTITSKLTYYSYYIFNGNDNECIKNISRGFALKYTPREIKMKIAALAAYLGKGGYYPHALVELAEESPELLYYAGKNYCIDPDGMDKFRFYSLALCYIDPDNIPENMEQSQIDEMTDFLLNTLKYNNTVISYSAAFSVSSRHSEEIRNLIKTVIKGKESRFIKETLADIPAECFIKNCEFIIDLLGFDNNVSLAKNGVKSCIDYIYNQGGFRYNNDGNNKAQKMLSVIAKRYPAEYIMVMRGVDMQSNSSYSLIFYCDHYENLYNILKESNPSAIEEFNIDYKKDVLDIAVKTERLLSLAAKDEIEKYLKLEDDISVLEPYYDLLEDPKHSKEKGQFHSSSLISALKPYPEYRNRYAVLKVLQGKYSVLQDTVKAAHISNGDSEEQEYLKMIINAMVTEKVPVSKRFAFYSWLCEAFYYEEYKKFAAETIIKTMVDNKDSLDEEYSENCLSGDIFARKLYAEYLGKTESEGRHRETLIKMCSDGSKEVRRAVVDVFAGHKEYEEEVIKLLEAKKQAARETAVDILSVWGADNYREVLTNAAEKEKSIKLADKIRDILALSSTAGNTENENGSVFSPMVFVNDIHKGGRNKKLLWLYETPNPEVHFNNGNKADDKYMQAILLCYAGMSSFGVSKEAELLAAELNQEELCRFAAEIFSKWHSDGAESKKKWVINFAAIHGGQNMIDTVLRCIKEWSENMRGAIAAEAVKALAMNGSSQALMLVDNIAHKFKQKQVKKAAVQALDSAAEALGMTADELGDKIVPNLGFDDNMQRIFDYGTRKFKVYITPALELEVYDENDKKLKSMPSPAKKDDEETAKKSNAEFKLMKKQLKNVVSIQKLRLETALLADRRWKKEAWEELFVKNPVMHSFAIGLIWTAYQEENVIQTFRYMEDGSFNTSDEDEFEMPENCTVGLAHPIDLDEETLSAWKEQLSDYEIVQPIEQLERKVYRIEPDEIGKFDLERFRGRTVNGMTLLGRATKLGWYKGSPQDAGCFFEFYREDITERIKNPDGTFRLLGNAVEFYFEGMYIGGEDQDLKIESVRFYKPGVVERGSYCYDKADDSKATKLDKISPRYFSEIINQLEQITK